MLYEVGDLQYASPATVSRCGMVFIDPKFLGWEPYAWKWIRSRQSQPQQDGLRMLFEKYVSALVHFVLEGLVEGEFQPIPKMVIPRTSLQLTVQLCFLLNHVLGEQTPTEFNEIEGVFVFCLVWSLGGSLVAESRTRFDAILKTVSQLPIIQSSSVPCGPSQLPAGHPTLYDYFYDSTTLKWTPWQSLVPAFVPVGADAKFYTIMVPTIDTVRNAWLTLACIEANRPPLLVGESGTAKTI